MKESEVCKACNLIENVHYLRFRISKNSKEIDEHKNHIKALQKDNKASEKQIIETEEELKKLGVEKDVNEEAN